MSEIAIIGAGAWGTGIAIVLGRKGMHRVRIWAHETDVCESINQRHVNDRFLAGTRIPDSVTASNDLAAVLDGAPIIISVMPSQHCRALFERMRSMISPKALIISATKGLEEGSLSRMSEVIADVLHRDGGVAHGVGALSGPSFAVEVARGDPTAIAIASQDPDLLRTVQQEFSDSSFRVYRNSDVVGVELGGALKNIIAIAAGISDGLGLRTQLSRRPDHARPCRNDAPRRSLRRPRRNHGRPRRPRRPGTDLHRWLVPKPQRRRRTGPRQETAGDHRRACTEWSPRESSQPRRQ